MGNNTSKKENSEFCYILISQLRPRSGFVPDPEVLADIKDSIKHYGILSPIIVVGPDSNGLYEILEGEHRFYAANLMNQEGESTIAEVPCFIINDGKNELLTNQLYIQLQINIKDSTHEETHRFEAVKMFLDLAETGKVPEEKVSLYLSHCFGVSPRYARMYKTVFQSGIPELVESVKCIWKRSDQLTMIDKLKKEGVRNPIVKVHIPLAIASNIAGKERSQTEQRKILYLVYTGYDVKEILRNICLLQEVSLSDRTISKALRNAVEAG